MVEEIRNYFKLIKEVSGISNKDETIDKVFNFYYSVSGDAEPSIYIQKLSIDPSIFNTVFSRLKNMCKEETLFSKFNFINKNTYDKIINIISVDLNKSYLLINPHNAKVGAFNNNFFNINIINDKYEHNETLKNYIFTNKSNFLSYYHTISNKINFSYTTKRENINQKKVNIFSSSSGDKFVSIQNNRSIIEPWIISKKITAFNIDLENDRCTSGGRPGIPGSIYIIFKDRTSIILFEKGTCLIVASKTSSYIDTKDFIKRTLVNVNDFINIFHDFMAKSTYHNALISYIKNKYLGCPHEGHLCNSCLWNRYISNIQFEGANNNLIDNEKLLVGNFLLYCMNYKMFLAQYKSDNLAIEEIFKMENTPEIINYISNYISQNNKSIISSIRISVYGLKRLKPITAGIYVCLPIEHRNRIDMFNGNAITYRSLKNITEGRLLFNAYNLIIDEIKKFKEERFKANVFSMNNNNLVDTVDEYINFLRIKID